VIIRIFRHPITQKTRRVLRRIVATCAVILAVVLVTTVTVDLGPSLKARAEQEASNYMRRPMHIGRLSVRIWLGRFVLEDVVIDGLPGNKPFLVAKRINISMPWSTLFTRRVVFDSVEMTDWQMYVETFSDGRHNLPRFTPETPRGPSAWTTTLQYVRAQRGECTYVDHGTPWSVVTRNLDVLVAKPNEEYRGQATFSNGTVAIQNYVPMRADMSTSFLIEDGKVILEEIELLTDGARSDLTGVVDLRRWPEQLYQVRSRVDFPRMREIFFADDDFSLAGEGDFQGTFHLFREVVSGRSRTGRELKGTFASGSLGVNAYRFTDFRGSVLWVPEKLEVTDASASLYGGTSTFTYRMEPLNQRGIRASATFDAAYQDVDLTEFSDFLELEGIRVSGRASGRNLLQWPLGRFAEHRGDGSIQFDAPPDVGTMTRGMLASHLDAAAARSRQWGPFDNRLPQRPVPIRGVLTYAYGPEWIDIAPSYVATPESYVELASISMSRARTGRKAIACSRGC
jgi:hypothetical protein